MNSDDKQRSGESGLATDFSSWMLESSALFKEKYRVGAYLGELASDGRCGLNRIHPVLGRDAKHTNNIGVFGSIVGLPIAHFLVFEYAGLVALGDIHLFAHGLNPAKLICEN